MGLGLLLIPALGGYLFVAGFNGTRDRLKRESGYHVVFRSAVAGIVLFGISRLLVVIADYFVPQGSCLREAATLWRTAFPMEYSTAAVTSLLLGWLSPYAINPLSDRTDARRSVASETGDHIGLLVDQAMETGRLMEISLEGGKSYVGAPLSRTFLARGDDGDLVVVPILSGHRDKDTRDLSLTVNYAPVLRTQLEDGGQDFELEDFRVAIPMREVVSARLFDPDAYKEFQRQD